MRLYRTNQAEGQSSRLLRRRGSNLLQMVLVFPVLLYLIFGAFEFGEYFYVKHAYSGAALEGAQTAVISGQTYATMLTNISNQLPGTLSRNYSVQVMDNGSVISSLTNVQAGDNITVTVSGTWNKIGSGFSAFRFIGPTKVVKGVAVMRAEMAP